MTTIKCDLSDCRYNNGEICILVEVDLVTIGGGAGRFIDCEACDLRPADKEHMNILRRRGAFIEGF